MHVDSEVQWGFLATILANSSDDTSRLVYADWLDERGDPLGELIRVQVEIAKQHSQGRSERHSARRPLEIRQVELLRCLEMERPALAELTRWQFDKPRFPHWSFGIDRGVITLSLHSLPPQSLIPSPSPEWISRFGWFILQVRTTAPDCSVFPINEGSFESLLISPLMDRSLGLDLSSLRLTTEQIRPLTVSPRTERLFTLSLWNNAIGTKGAEILSESPHFPKLVDLNFGNNPIGDQGLSALSESNSFSELRRLTINGTGAGPAGWAALAKSQVFGRLRELTIFDTPLDADAAHAMGESRRFPGLGRLNLLACNINDENAQKLASGTGLTRLDTLILDSNPISDIGAEAILRSPLFAQTAISLNLTKLGPRTIRTLAETGRFKSGCLRLWNCGISDDAIEVLAALPESTDLENLTIGYSSITDQGVICLANSPYLKNLRYLNLSFNRIGLTGANSILDRDSFPRLEELALSDNPLGNSGAIALAQWYHRHGEKLCNFHRMGVDQDGVLSIIRSGFLKGIHELSFSPSRIGDEGIAALAESHDFVELEQLCLWNSGITDSGVQALIRSSVLSPNLHLLLGDNPLISPSVGRALLARYPGSHRRGVEKYLGWDQ